MVDFFSFTIFIEVVFKYCKIMNCTINGPPNSSRFSDKEFISKFETMLDTATADGKVLLKLIETAFQIAEF